MMVNFSFTLILLEKQHVKKREKDRQKMQEALQGQMTYVMIIQMYRWRAREARELQIPKV